MKRRIYQLISCATLALSLAPGLLQADSYTQTNLVSDIPGLAANTDPNLKNPWGISFAATSPFWTANQASSTSTLYDSAGTPLQLVVNVPSPTGTVFTGGSGFSGSGGQSVLFAFATTGGSIYGWNSSNGTTAQSEATTPGASYLGLAMAQNGTANFLYAANTAAGTVDVFNSSFTKVTLAGSFSDPNLPKGYVPFGIHTINGQLYVTYMNPGQNGTGNGVVAVFDSNGSFVREIAKGGQLDSPWGVVIAPADFGHFGQDLLVGNFGNGEINAYDPTSGSWLGTIEDSKGNPIVNSGLWELATRSAAGYNANAIYFTAGINGEQDGLLGEISPSPEPFSAALVGLGALGLGAVAWRRRSPSSQELL